LVIIAGGGKGIYGLSSRVFCGLFFTSSLGVWVDGSIVMVIMGAYLLWYERGDGCVSVAQPQLPKV
jgi:hypothetical protein